MWETDTFYEICFQQNVLRSAKNREIAGRRALLRKAASMITVNRCGYDSRHTAVLDSLNPRGNEDYTLLLIKTESFFEKDGKYTELPPNTGLLYGRHSYVHYGCRMGRMSSFFPGCPFLWILLLRCPISDGCPSSADWW